MKKIKLYSNNALLRLSLLGAFVLGVTACASGGSSSSANTNGTNGDASTLQVITPKTIYSKPDTAGSAYVVIKNPTNTAVKNLHYSLTNPIGSASKAVIDPVSAANCSTIAAYNQCNVKVNIAAGAVAGSFGFSLYNNTTLLSKLVKSVQTTALAGTMGVEQAAYNSLKDANGITLSYYNTVINGTAYILVSGLVASNNAGTYDKVVLVNGSDAEIPNQQLISPVSNAQGSTFSILLPVPSANNATQTIKVQTQQNNAVVSTATTSSTLSTQQNIGIADMLPSAVYLTTANPEQTITLANTGDVTAQLEQLISNNPNIEVIFSPSSLTSGATSTATLKLKNPAIPATSSNVTLTYNNGQNQISTSGNVGQNIDPAPGPTPTPTPTPTPAPPPVPAAVTITLFSPPWSTVAAPASSSLSTMMGSAYAFTATITGGSSTVTPTVTAGLTGAAVSPTSCDLDSKVSGLESCTFIVTPYNTDSNSYSFWNPASVANSTDVGSPAVAYIQSNISLQVTATNNATVNSNSSPYTFSNITGTVVAPYVYLPQTGQTPSSPITATAGMDGDIHTGIPWVYVTSGSTTPATRFTAGTGTEAGCITDNLTGLMWVKDLNTVAIDGASAGTSTSRQNALDSIETANNGSGYCGYTDWYLPTVNDLSSLLNDGQSSPATWLNAQGFAYVQASTYWSSSTSASDATNAWLVRFNNGGVGAYNKTTNGYVWPVRLAQ